MFLVKGEILFTLEILCQTQMGFAEKDAGLKLPCETLAVRSVPREKQGRTKKGDILTPTPHPEQLSQGPLLLP